VLSTRRLALATSVAQLSLCALALGCADPIERDVVSTLGPETNGIPIGPLHRPGQPCVVCHDGNLATELSLAGTIYERADAPKPVADVLVHLLDAQGAAHKVATNCAGNFFVRPGDYTPAFPLWVAIEREGYRQEMDSPINGEGSCAACHTANEGPTSASRVFLLSFDAPLGQTSCP